MVKNSLAALAGEAGAGFGTSGVRGLVTALSPEVCRAYTQAFLALTGLPGGPLLIGQDLRPSSPAIARACAMEARSLGFTPVNAGVLPTPALAFAAQCRAVPAIMVTGSHIPFDRNGLKFYLPQGEITKEDEARMLATPISPAAPVSLATRGADALPAADPAIAALYTARYLNVFSPGRLEGLRVGVYEHSSAARDLLHDILRRLGAETVGLGRSDSFVPIDTEAVREEDRALGRQWAREHRLDAIITTDGDADRPLIADENGEWIRGDVAGILCAREIGARTVVTPVSSNSAVEGCGAFAEVIRTRIGSPHVIAGMEGARLRPVAGYEANGGFLLGDAVTLEGGTLDALATRDSVLPVLMLLTAARRRGCSVSTLVAELPARFTHSDRLQNVDVAACRAMLASLEREEHSVAELAGGSLGKAMRADCTDGLRVTFETGDVVHVRLSGNAPELRCYTEAASPARAALLCRQMLQQISLRLAQPACNPVSL